MRTENMVKTQNQFIFKMPVPLIAQGIYLWLGTFTTKSRYRTLLSLRGVYLCVKTQLDTDRQFLAVRYHTGFYTVFHLSTKIVLSHSSLFTVLPVPVLPSVADPDPGSGIRCLFDPWIRDPGWVESQHPDPGSGMNNPDHIF
jgi:hypothetical protein